MLHRPCRYKILAALVRVPSPSVLPDDTWWQLSDFCLSCFCLSKPFSFLSPLAFCPGMATGCSVLQTSSTLTSKLAYESFLYFSFKFWSSKAYKNIYMTYIWITKHNNNTKTYKPTNQKKKLALSLCFPVFSQSPKFFLLACPFFFF